MKEELLALEVADLFKNFSDSTRVKIIMALMKEELSVNHLSERIQMSQTNTSHQLRILRQNRIVKYRKQGKQVLYSLDDEHIINILLCGIEHIEEME